MSVNNIRNQLSSLITDVGKAGANAIFPNDVEYYAVSLELTDSKNQTIDYLTFPVSPSQIEYDDVKVATVTKTFGGVSALDNDTFIPKRISLSGTFGRKLRLLLGPDQNQSIQSTQGGVFDKLSKGLQIKTSILNAKIKTGYGSTKLLESIITKSSGLDQYNQPNRLYLYIPSLGHSFLVKSVGSFNLKQDYQSSNMMWQYNMAFSTLCRTQDLDNPSLGSLIRSTGMNVLQKQTNALVANITNIL